MVGLSYTKHKEKNSSGAMLHCCKAKYWLAPEANLVLTPREHLLKPHAGLQCELSSRAEREMKSLPRTPGHRPKSRRVI